MQEAGKEIPYNSFSNYLKTRYGQRVYKLPLNIQVTCPNKDGTLESSGCSFCGAEGAGFENLSNKLEIKTQLQKNRNYIKNKLNVQKFIAYFQNYSNTYLHPDTFEYYLKQACEDDIAALYISTRPDCVTDKHIEIMKTVKIDNNVDIVVELGLQSINHKTLKAINRGHSLAEFIDTILRIKNNGIDSCVHYILDLPMDEIDDVIEGAKIVSALGVNQVKCHSLYILEGTAMGDAYSKGELKPLSMSEFIERAVYFLEYLDPSIVIQRLLGRAPESRTLFCNWNTSWWKIRDEIEDKMRREGRYQGRLFDYLVHHCVNTHTYIKAYFSVFLRCRRIKYPDIRTSSALNYEKIYFNICIRIYAMVH